MRKIILILAVLTGFSTIARAGSTTPVLGMYIPAVGEYNWGTKVGNNFLLVLDSAAITDLPDIFIATQAFKAGITIGTVTAPTATLLILSTSTQTTWPVLDVQNQSGTSLFRCQQNGNCGIGATVPDAYLNVQGAGNSSIHTTYFKDNIVTGGSQKFGTIRYSDNATYSAFFDWNASSMGWSGPGQGVENLTITSGGNVGIGTVLPQGTLDVNGSFYLSPSTSNIAGAWTAFTPGSIVGWVSPVVNVAKYTRIGKTLFLNIDISGTSNSTAVSFTIPFNMTNAGYGIFAALAIDNGASAVSPGRCDTATPTPNNKFNCYVNFSAASWTASGTKELNLTATVETP